MNRSPYDARLASVSPDLTRARRELQALLAERTYDGMPTARLRKFLGEWHHYEQLNERARRAYDTRGESERREQRKIRQRQRMLA